MRVYVAATPARLAGLRRHGLPAGTEGYAATPGLAEALGLRVEEDEETAEELGEAVLEAAAEASLLLLADEPGPGGDDDRTRPDPTGSMRRVVVVVQARARAVEDADHPATVVLTAPLRWSAVESVLADDATAAGRVGRAAVLARTDQDRAVDRLERDQLGWFGPDELD